MATKRKDPKDLLPVGRPTDYKPDFHPKDFIRLSKLGKHKYQIALAWDHDRDTLKEWEKVHPEFSAAVQKGKQYAEAWYVNIGQMAMMGQAAVKNEDGTTSKITPNLGYYSWLMKNLFKWTDRVETKTEHSGDLHTHVTEMTDDELRAKIKKLSKSNGK
jgi:hypothetical protein